MKITKVCRDRNVLYTQLFLPLQYAFEEFCQSGRQPEFLTCIQNLQEWNRPKLEAIPILELGSQKQVILKKTARRLFPSQCDPQPSSMQSSIPALVEKLRVDILSMKNSSVLTQLLAPSIKVALHDHNYCSGSGGATFVPSTDAGDHRCAKRICATDDVNTQ